MLRVRARGRTISFGLQSGADVTAEEIRDRSEGGIPKGVAFTVVTSSGKAEVFLPAVGTHNVYNALAAVSVGCLLGVPFEEICQGLEGFHPLPMRMAFLRLKGLDILDDTYNANPDSMAAALEVLSGLQKDRTGIAVLGDMLELGDYAPRAHWELGQRAGTLGIHGLVAMGQFASRIVEGAEAGGMDRTRIRVGADPEHAAAMLLELRHGRTVALVKGSRGMKMEKVIESIRKKYDS
ncbi:MAG: hypothetical protein HZA19_05180 [Nitrospirae bacterium]|nr:hypothetical protein [Nitrospirota bacterium]